MAKESAVQSVVVPAVVEIDLDAKKEAIGSILPDNKFEFVVLDEDGTLKAKAYNDANGNIIFPPFLLTIPGEYYFDIRENPSSDPNWETDQTVFPVVVIVTQDALGLKAEIKYPMGEPVFINKFVGTTGSCPVTGYQIVDMHLPVKVKPSATVGPIKTNCCGKAVVSPMDECGFMISQKLCIEVPVEFKAETTTGEVQHECRNISSDNICNGCNANG